MYTLFTPDPADYNTRLNLQTKNTMLDSHTHPKILGLIIIELKLTYNRYIESTATKASQTLTILNVLFSIKILLSTYTVITRSMLEYASKIWSPNTSITNITKLKLYKPVITHHNYTFDDT